jgi:hypothetical protein
MLSVYTRHAADWPKPRTKLAPVPLSQMDLGYAWRTVGSKEREDAELGKGREV